jgi:regulation of enolase protein 1 (concanavalin A-like superfamily)
MKINNKKGRKGWDWGCVIYLVDYLLSLCKALASITSNTKFGMLACNPDPRTWEVEAEGFESRPPAATQPVI